MRCGQLSMMAGAMLLDAMSARLCVANSTATFFLRSTFSHSRMRAANSGWSRKIQASSRTSKVGRPSNRSFQSVKEIGQHWRDHAGLTHQRFGLEALGRRRRRDAARPRRVAAHRGRPACRRRARCEAHWIGGAVSARSRVRSSGGADARLAERRPDGILHLGRDEDLLSAKQRRDPFRRPASLGGVHRSCAKAGTPASHRHRHQGRAHGVRHPSPARPPARKTLVEDIDLGAA